MSGECQVNVKSQSELDIGGRETCLIFNGSMFHKTRHSVSNKITVANKLRLVNLLVIGTAILIVIVIISAKSIKSCMSNAKIILELGLTVFILFYLNEQIAELQGDGV